MSDERYEVRKPGRNLLNAPDYVYDTQGRRSVPLQELARRLNAGEAEIRNLRREYAPAPVAGENWWSCLVGPCEFSKLEPGSDQPMRVAVVAAFLQLHGHDPGEVFSGWGTAPTALQREVIEEADDRITSDPAS